MRELSKKHNGWQFEKASNEISGVTSNIPDPRIQAAGVAIDKGMELSPELKKNVSWGLDKMSEASPIGMMRKMDKSWPGNKPAVATQSFDEFAKDRKANVPSVKADGTMQRLGNTEVQRAQAKKIQGPEFTAKKKIDLSSIF